MTEKQNEGIHTLFKKNIEALREVDHDLADSVANSVKGHDLEMVQARNGMPSLKVNSIALHSLYDPVKEAQNWVDHYKKEIDGATTVSLLGFGLGYHIQELCKVPDKDITVYEPRLDIIRAALESLDLMSSLKRIKIITDDSIPSMKGKTLILQHKPSVNLNKPYHERIMERLKARINVHQGMRILVVGPVYGGSLQIARYCSATLKKMGHDVELVDNSRFSDALFHVKDISGDKASYNRLIDKLSAFLSEAVIAKCETFKPDLVFALAQAPLTVECLRRLRGIGIATAFWFVEDFRFMDYWQRIAGYYDYFFTIQKGDFFSELDKSGIRNFSYLPLAADPDVHKKTGMSEGEKSLYGSDISFLGAGYYNRKRLFKGLLDLDFKIWGTDWDMDSALARCVQRSGDRIEADEAVMIFNASKININLHSSTYHKGVNPFGDFVNPRTFEIAACGGFQLVDNRSELKDLFIVGEEIAVFKDLEGLRQKIAFYLENTEERNQMAERARQRVLKEHTYEHRMREMLDSMSDRGFQPSGGKVEGEDVDDLMEQARTDKGLAGYLSKFAEREKITLPEIVENIENSEGDLSYPETMFLIMNELVK